MKQKTKKYFKIIGIILIILIVIYFFIDKEKFKKYKSGLQDGIKIGRHKIYPLSPDENLDDDFDFDFNL